MKYFKTFKKLQQDFKQYHQNFIKKSKMKENVGKCTQKLILRQKKFKIKLKK